MPGPSRVFVSSTSLDLDSYRAAATRAIISAGDLPDDMVYWPAEESRPLVTSLARVLAADLVILIVAHRFGHIPTNETKSITQLEFEHALRHSIPVLSFIVDPDVPWPPKFLDRDPSLSLKLSEFVALIESQTTVARFSTPESLEVKITASISAYRTRRGGDTPTDAVYRRAARIHPPERLLYAPDCNVRIGTAPDGLPMLLSIHRDIGLFVVDQILNHLTSSESEVALRGIKDELVQLMRAQAISRGVVTCDWGGESTDCFISEKSMVHYFAPSILEQLLVSGPLPRQRRSPELRQTTSTSGLESETGWDPRVKSTGGQNRFLVIPLRSDRLPASGGLEGETFRKWRSFIEEGFECFIGVRYEIFEQTPRKSECLISTRSPEQYKAEWSRLLLERDASGLLPIYNKIVLSRTAVLEFVLRVVDELALMHDAGIIHGDLKPSNILAGRGGGLLIDGGDLKPGEVSPTVTVGWSPPEQLSRRPVSFSADVYAVGILLMQLMGGVQLGRLVQYKMPNGVVASIVDDPTVYVEPDSVVFRHADRRAWLAMVERAIRTDPAQRYDNAAALGQAIREALIAGTLGGDLCVQGPPGNVPLLATDGSGVMPAWNIGARESV